MALLSPPKSFVRELKRIDSRLYPLYFDRFRKWMIVSPCQRPVAGVTEYDPTSEKHVAVEFLIEDENGRPLPLSSAVLHVVKLAFCDTTRRKPFSFYWKAFKESERRRQFVAARERQSIFKEAGREIKKFKTSETFVLGR